MVIWLIGMSGTGKTTIGTCLWNRLQSCGKKFVNLDGDEFREIFKNDLGHSLEDREKNAHRISHFCKFLDNQGFDVICSVLSIFPEWQKWNRDNFVNYTEVFVNVPFEKLVDRDIKGLYKKALVGEIKDVVGVDIKFPIPPNPDIVIENDFELGSLDSYVDLIMSHIGYK